MNKSAVVKSVLYIIAMVTVSLAIFALLVAAFYWLMATWPTATAIGFAVIGIAFVVSGVFGHVKELYYYYDRQERKKNYEKGE